MLYEVITDLGAWFKEEHAIPGEPALDVAEDGDPDGDDPRH